jgi:tol-pal system protein YbgF
LFFTLAGCGNQDLKSNEDFVALNDRVTKLGLEVALIRDDVRDLKGDGIEAGGTIPKAMPMGEGPEMPASQVSGLYRQARALYLRGDYPSAAKMFARIAAQAPRHDLAPNARYWLGECYYSLGRYKDALAEFNGVLRYYPGSTKAPDAMFKMAYCYSALNDGPAAMNTMRELLERYPKSPAAKMVKAGRTSFITPQ